jgi:flagellar biosynthetic protein FliQ
MTPEFVVGFARQAIELTLMISLPLLGVGLGVGLFVSIIQAATQIQEATLAFIPKIISMFVALLIAFPWIMERLLVFTRDIFINLPQYVRMGSGG